MILVAYQVPNLEKKHLRTFSLHVVNDCDVLMDTGREFQTYGPEKAKLVLYKSMRT